MKNKIFMAAIIFSAVIFILQTPLAVNLWFTLTDPVYLIPDESSLFSFKPAVMNSGSGDWWIYGEDTRFYYYFSGDQPVPYLKCSKGEAENCPGFRHDDVSSWCLPDSERSANNPGSD